MLRTSNQRRVKLGISSDQAVTASAPALRKLQNSTRNTISRARESCGETAAKEAGLFLLWLTQVVPIDARQLQWVARVALSALSLAPSRDVHLDSRRPQS